MHSHIYSVYHDSDPTLEIGSAGFDDEPWEEYGRSNEQAAAWIDDLGLSDQLVEVDFESRSIFLTGDLETAIKKLDEL